MEAERRPPAVDEPLSSVRIRAEGALEVVERGTAEALAVCESLEESNWHLRLEGLSAFGRSIAKLDESYEKLEAMAVRDGWSAEHEATRTLHDFVAILARLREIVGRRLRESGIDGGAAELDDAIAQLVARASVKRPQWTRQVARRARFISFALGFGSFVVLFGSAEFLARQLGIDPSLALLFSLAPLALVGPVQRRLLRVRCPGCFRPFFVAEWGGLAHSASTDACPHCGLRL